MTKHPSMQLDLPTQNGIHVHGAGIVLAIPFLSRLWSFLDWVTEQTFVDQAAAERAANILGFLQSGAVAPDGQVSVLNRLLCGLPLDELTTRPFCAENSN